jgi:hypothetical protein
VIRGLALQARTDSLRIGRFADSPCIGTHGDGRFVSFAELAGLVNARTAGLPPELDGVRLNCRHGYRAPFKILDIEQRYGNLTLTYTAQVHIAVIEIDSLTHNIEVLDDTVVDDCGPRGLQICACCPNASGARLLNSRYRTRSRCDGARRSRECDPAPMGRAAGACPTRRRRGQLRAPLLRGSSRPRPELPLGAPA